ncbi:aminoglycoside phosphotransferase family protein [Acrocarpospora corrugata]|uniref:phosphotransferase n=1 Tax=Acrocarpospora corrugata TaxID=35763 RepID=UPI001478C29E|nr:aminoglycoside phosphotransferase family protein [Acrocarpospora corrugata]
MQPLSGGTVSGSVERITLHMSGISGDADPATREVQVVRKRAFPHEVAGLSAAQALRPAATAIPELITWGRDQYGLWLITPFVAGVLLSDQEAPANLFESLARLHGHFHGAADLPDELPRVDVRWWQQLCLEWVLPQIARHSDRHPLATITRASAVVTDAATHGQTLTQLSPTLLHGDVHPGNVLIDGQSAWLIDWGSCRVGPAMLDLANLVALDSEEFAIYRRAWEESTEIPFDADQADLGYRWAALQIPIQYLPWMIENLTTTEVETALDRAEQALAAL